MKLIFFKRKVWCL